MWEDVKNTLFPQEGWYARAKAAYTGMGASPNQLLGPHVPRESVSAADSNFISMAETKRRDRIARGEMLLNFIGGIKAYHGSPHIFDKFSLRHIGRGEGAQAFGRGLYFAENPKVAQGYRQALSGSDLSGFKLDGKPIEQFFQPNKSVYDSETLQNLGLSHRDLYWLLRWKNNYPELSADEFMKLFAREMPTADKAMLPNVLARVEKGAPQKAGALYEVDLNVEPNKLLNLDVPFKQQTKEVRKNYPIDARIAAQLEAWTNGKWSPTIELSPDRFAAAEQLRERGIPGARYLDRNSRSVGAGTNNYVIWDDKLIKILKRYGIGGGAVGANALMGTEDE